MTAITIRDVPEPVLQGIKRKAAQSGKSLQAYLLDLVTRDQAKPTMAEMMERLDRETSARVSVADVLAAIDEGRAGR
jgi:antitoxin FitA